MRDIGDAALPLKADMLSVAIDVCLVPGADIRYTGLATAFWAHLVQLLDAGYRGLKAQLDAKKLKEMRKVKAMLLKRF